MNFIHQHLEEVDSTNHALWELSEKIQLSDFHTISADYQWSGKGQDTNTWYSSKSHNILLSTIAFTGFVKAADAFHISMWVSLSILEYLKSMDLEDVQIKWPNDIYVGNKKIAGILIQNAISGNNLSKSLIGIGLNLNEKTYPSTIPNPISLSQLVQQDYMVLDETYSLLSIIQKNFTILKKTPQKMMRQYHKNLYRLDKWEKYQIKGVVQEAKIIGVDEFGRLGLENKNRVLTYSDLKEVQFIWD